MKKIMFNEHYGLETATLNGSKTRTSRIEFQTNANFTDMVLYTKSNSNIKFVLFDFDDGKSYKSRYGIGETVAIAQCYEKILSDSTVKPNYHILMSDELLCKTAGWGNKMFAKAEYMPHQIMISDINLERLQDISDDDCIREGIIPSPNNNGGKTDCWYVAEFGKGYEMIYYSPREAFAALIDAISGRGTWESNPWVVVYYYELIA